MKHLLTYTEKMLLETVINFDADFESDIKSVFKGSDYEHIIKDLLKLKDKDIDVKSNKPMFLIKGNVGSNMINITDKDPMKIGRLIKLLLPDTTAKDIEKITNLWVGGVKQDLKEVKGDKIKYYYQRENTEDIGDTELKDSCMNDKDDSLLDIYTVNDNVKLLIKLNEDGLLTTRALLFNTIEKGWVMSRVYFNRPSEKVEFENYAKDNDIYILTTKRDWDKTLTVQLKESEFDMYPYLDHFKYLNIDKKQLSTTWNQWEGNDDNVYELRETNGGFEVTQNVSPLEKFIKACEGNNIELVKQLLKDDRVDPSDEDNYAIRKASEKGYDKVVELLLNDGRADPSDDDNYAIRKASEYGYYNVVKLLLKDNRVDPSDDDNYAICCASENGHDEVVKLLLNYKGKYKNKIDITEDDNYAIRMASYNGHVKVVELLLKDKRVNPSDVDNHAIYLASKKGHVKVVELLLKDKRVDPSDIDNRTIYNASFDGHDKVVTLLLKDKRVDPSDVDNRTIRWASKNGHDKVVELLAKNEKVIQKAKDMNDTEVLDILKKYGSITERKRNYNKIKVNNISKIILYIS